MPTPTIEVVQKLMQLALHNPNEAEAMSAALKAIRMIDKFSLPVGDNVVHRSDRAWEPPPPDFYATVEDIFADKAKQPDEEARAYDSPYQGAPPAGQQAGLTAPERELEDRQSAFAKQMVRAWRAIREARRALGGEFYRWETRNGGRRFVCDDCGKKPL